MSIHVALNHVSHYAYDRPVALGPQVVRLRPAPHSRTRILSYSMRVEPAQHFLNWQQDPQSNWLARLVFPERTRELRIEIDLVAEMAVFNPFDFFLEPYAERFPFEYDAAQRHELEPYLVRTEATPAFARRLAAVPREPMQTIDFLVALNQRLQEEVAYLIRMEPGVQTPEQTLVNGSGSCRDSAWLLVQLLRHLGLAARFVSGYLIQLVPDVKSLDGPSGAERDFTDLHAWCEVYLPGAGWIGLDPTSGLLAGEGHVPVACTPEPSSAAPVSGLVEPAECVFTHTMSVRRAFEAPRVTKPYDDMQWEAIDALGRRVDADLVAGDVRLTQGGEPTFVSIDDRDGAEWNTEAMGPDKRRLSGELLERMAAQHGRHGLPHFGQGKWYPGEQLPRWSLNWFWRKDGQPIVSDPSVLASEAGGGAFGASPDVVDAAGIDEARALVTGVATRLGLDAGLAFEAYEDPWHFSKRELQLPVNVDPADSKLDDPMERERLARVFERGLDAPVGWILPMTPNPAARRGPSVTQPQQLWQATGWPLRTRRCYLAPGDSAIGYRLPLGSLPWVAPNEYPWIHAADPMQPEAPLPGHAALLPTAGAWTIPARDGRTQALDPTMPAGAGARPQPALAARATAGARTASQPIERDAADGQGSAAGGSYAGVARTALCIEPRDGRLYVFMPPAANLDEYLQLVAAVEATARDTGLRVVFEGYEPPRDPRLAVLRITPDPGVIEVNVAPASSWDELASRTTALYDAAHQTRLSTEKFMLDGRHVGTGGGNHVVLGGDTPADSPFLRRPDLLASLIAWWLAHPSLSYLFSGLFIGPTSQAPRIDEARHDSVRELEIAFSEIARLQALGEQACPPWLLDRVLRNLLVDVTGNTHRAEFCIDKLYSPDSASGRLGLLELRGFEMPPHARMSLVQMLLLRALVARFWRSPLRPERLPRWGTALHDRFMLPTHVREDLREVIDDLRAHGYPFELEWFAPHWEFRFPKLGDFEAGGVRVELRMALEPWPVMGEEGAAGGTVRFVDASLERIELVAHGLIEGRHALTVNGRTVPLQRVGPEGAQVGGVRYRAWKPTSCLHPTIDVHAPLTVDLVDTWNRRSMGGCQYHVAHPGGRNHETFPVNAYEAEARRLARFFRMGHTPGEMNPSPARIDPETPCTLDLRRA
ncbi:MAG: transglutaminase family protein [Burkholderiales bacterium]|nr:MAG: transglutaminase family protein [Burkholderiales bacterium]